MKNKLLTVGMVVVCIMAMGLTAVYQGTLHQQYLVLRAEASEDTPINLTTAGAFASKPATAKALEATGSGTGIANAVQITVAGGDAVNDTFSWKIYAWRRANGPAELVAYGTGILGTQQVTTYSQGGIATDKFWADTFVITAQYWLTTVRVSTVGGNSVASIWFDAVGYEWIYLEITDADGSGSEAESITGYYSYY